MELGLGTLFKMQFIRLIFGRKNIRLIFTP